MKRVIWILFLAIAFLISLPAGVRGAGLTPGDAVADAAMPGAVISFRAEYLSLSGWQPLAAARAGVWDLDMKPHALFAGETAGWRGEWVAKVQAWHELVWYVDPPLKFMRMCRIAGINCGNLRLGPGDLLNIIVQFTGKCTGKGLLGLSI